MSNKATLNIIKWTESLLEQKHESEHNMAALIGIGSGEPSRRTTQVEEARVDEREAGVVEGRVEERVEGSSEMTWEAISRLERIEGLVRKVSRSVELSIPMEPRGLSEEQFAALMAAVQEKLNEARGPEHVRTELARVEPGQLELDQDRRRRLKRFIWLKAAGRILTALSSTILAFGLYMSMVLYQAALALGFAAPIATLINLAGSGLIAITLSAMSSMATRGFAIWLDAEVEQEKKRLLTEQVREEQRFQKLLEE